MNEPHVQTFFDILMLPTTNAHTSSHSYLKTKPHRLISGTSPYRLKRKKRERKKESKKEGKRKENKKEKRKKQSNQNSQKVQKRETHPTLPHTTSPRKKHLHPLLPNSPHTLSHILLEILLRGNPLREFHWDRILFLHCFFISAKKTKKREKASNVRG